MQNKIFIFANQCQLETLQIAAELDRRMQICHVTTNSGLFRKIWKNGSRTRMQHYEGLQELDVNADKMFLKLSYVMLTRQICSYGFQKEMWILWAIACRQTHWSAKINNRYWSFLLCSYSCNFKIMEAIPNQSNSYPKNSGRPFKDYGLQEWSIYWRFRQEEWKSDLPTCDIYGWSVFW